MDLGAPLLFLASFFFPFVFLLLTGLGTVSEVGIVSAFPFSFVLLLPGNRVHVFFFLLVNGKRLQIQINFGG